MAGKTTKKKASSKLHYDKEALMKDYNFTFAFMLKGMAIFVAIILMYFLLIAVYLGDASHTPPEPFVEQFGDRIDIEYDGKKLPMYEGDE